MPGKPDANPDFPRLTWPEPSLAYQLGVHSPSKSSFLMPTPKPPSAILFFPLVLPLPNYFHAFSILKFPDFFFYLHGPFMKGLSGSGNMVS